MISWPEVNPIKGWAGTSLCPHERASATPKNAGTGTCPPTGELTVRRVWLAVVALMLGAAPARAAPATFASHIAPIFEENCTVCHGEKKQKAGLRLDSFASVMKGGENGAVIKPGVPGESELYVRVTLDPEHEDFMPADSKPPLSAEDTALIQKWIAAGASATKAFDAPAPAPAVVVVPAAPDYRPRLAAVAALERTLGVRLVPRSRVPTDGLVLRTASAPGRCDDAVLAQLAPFADLIVEAELARTKVTDAGLREIGTWKNLVRLDLSRTAVTSAGIAALASLSKLETANLTATKVDDSGLAKLRTLPALKQVWTFDTAVSESTR